MKSRSSIGDETKFKNSRFSFAAIAQAAPLAIVLLDRDEHVLHWNPAAERMFGWRQEEVLGKPYPLVGKEQEAESKRLHQRSLSGESVPAVEACRQRKDGSPIHISTACTPLPDENGAVEQVMLIITDVTGRVEAERALRDSQERYRNLFDNSVGFICLHKLDGSLISVNPAAARALGYSQEDAFGRNLRDFETPEAQANFDAYLEQLRLHGRHADETHVRTRDGQERIWYYSNVVIRPPGEEPYVIGNAVDITDFKQAERALRQRQEYERKLLESISDVVIIMEADGTIRDISPSVEHMFGYKSEDRKGRTAFENVHPEDLPNLRKALAEGLGQPGPASAQQYRVRHADGHWVQVETVSNNLLHDPLVRGIIITIRDISERKRTEVERESLIGELQEALGKVKMLTGLLPICASCKKIRDDQDTWTQIEAYVRDHSEAKFSHGLCPDCARRLYPDYYKK